MLLDKKQLIYGCMNLGGGWDTNAITNNDIIEAEKAIETAVVNGITFFDHADIYKIGKSEQVFGKLLAQNSALRTKIIIQTKAGIRYHEGKLNSSIYDFSKAYLIQQVEKSLKQLHTDYLDVFMLHRPDILINPEELAETFSELKTSGKVNHFAVSNMSTPQIKHMQSYLDEPLLANQIQLSLGHTMLLDAEVSVNRYDKIVNTGVEDLLQYAQKQQMTIQVWGSLDNGRFTGNTFKQQEGDEKVIDFVQLLSEKYNVSKEAIVLAWLFKIPANIQPVIGTTNTKRIEACAQALTLELSREDWYNLWILKRDTKLP